MRKRNFLKSHQAQIYKRSRFENPYFSSKKPSQWKKIIIIPLIIFFLSFIIWGLISLPFMHINKFDIQGLVTIQPNSIEQTLQSIISQPIVYVIPGDHRWFTNIKKIEDQLKDAYQLKQISVEKNGKTLLITIEERITRAVWISNDQYYFLDADGSIVRELSPEERVETEQQINSQTIPTNYLQAPIFAIWDTSNTLSQIDQNVISPILLSNINDFDLLLHNSTIQPISYLIEKQNEIWVTAKTTLGVDIYINGAGDAKEQFDYLEIVLSDYQDQIHNLEYIDLRFGNRIYIR